MLGGVLRLAPTHALHLREGVDKGTTQSGGEVCDGAQY